MTQEELLLALADASTKNDAGQTSEEIAASMGVSTKIALGYLKVANRAGKLTVGERRGYRTDRRPMIVPVYWVSE